MTWMQVPWLSLSIWTPILCGVLVLLLGKTARIARVLALTGSVLSLLVTVPLYIGFNPSVPGLQWVEHVSWIAAVNINYSLGIDGISLWFVALTAFITILVVLAGWQVIEKHVAQYFGAFLILSGLMIAVFCAQDALLFYLFFEATLIPMYLIVGIWGGSNRIYAALKLFLYTLTGSVLMLIAMIYLYHKAGGSFSLQDWYVLPLQKNEQFWLFWAFFAAFAVKVPMWPVHTWLPDAHVEAPTGGSMVLAAIMLKLGAYGFLRFNLPILPEASLSMAWIVAVLSLIAIVYIGLVAMVQQDMKKLVAYSSIAHMGFVTLGIFLFSILGVQGALVQMISHGFISAGMFFCIGVLYDRMHSRKISDYGGVINTMPRFGAFFVLFAMANCGLPATSGFVGELMVIMAAMEARFWIAVVAATTLILSAAYSLWLVKRVLFGETKHAAVQKLTDINSREFFILAILALCVIAVGVYPKMLTDSMQVSLDYFIRLIEQRMLTLP
jgi:NADH-quinone oxidoreductase subunit M